MSLGFKRLITDTNLTCGISRRISTARHFNIATLRWRSYIQCSFTQRT